MPRRSVQKDRNRVLRRSLRAERKGMATLSTKKHQDTQGWVVRSLRGNRHPELKDRGQKRWYPKRVTRWYPIGVTQFFRRSLKRVKRDNDTSTCKTQDTQGRKRLEVLKDGAARRELWGAATPRRARAGGEKTALVMRLRNTL
jgi:hypothetical protein